MSTTALAVVNAPSSIDATTFFSPSQIDLIKRTIAKDCTDDELRLFLYQCARTGLDPFSKQIYAIVRRQYNPETRQKEPRMTIQTGIDGLRLIADRTGRYAPGPKPIFEYDKSGRPTEATAFVKKRTPDGVWHLVEASAYYDEYVQLHDGKLQGQWSKPRMMLGKCAEALALRKAFPAEMSGIYTADEMGQADRIDDAGSGPNGRISGADVAASFEASKNAPPSRLQDAQKGWVDPSPKAPAPIVASAPPATSGVAPPAGSIADADGVVAEFQDLVDVWRWVKADEVWVEAEKEPKRRLDQNARLHALKGELGIEDGEWRTKLVSYYNKDSSALLCVREADDLVAKLEKRRKMYGTAADKTARQQRRLDEVNDEMRVHMAENEAASRAREPGED